MFTFAPAMPFTIPYSTDPPGATTTEPAPDGVRCPGTVNTAGTCRRARSVRGRMVTASRGDMDMPSFRGPTQNCELPPGAPLRVQSLGSRMEYSPTPTTSPSPFAPSNGSQTRSFETSTSGIDGASAPGPVRGGLDTGGGAGDGRYIRSTGGCTGGGYARGRGLGAGVAGRLPGAAGAGADRTTVGAGRD